ncbi:MAG: helix-turn-helix domain-containing protein [Pseudonocardiaceae bacterium]
MTELAPDDGFDHIASVAHLGSLLRRLRGDKTQQNIADHAKRHHLYVHRPDISAIERGRRLPTSNELRGILYGCGRLDLFDRLDGIRRELMAEPADPPTSNDQHQSVIYLSAAAPDISDEAAPLIRSQKLDHGRRRIPLFVVFAAVAVVFITAVLALVYRARDTSTPPSVSEAPPPQLKMSSAPDGAGNAMYNTNNNHYQIYDTKKDRRAVAVIFYRSDRLPDFVGFQSCHEGAGNDCPGDLSDSVTGLLCMKTGVGLGANPTGYTFGEEVCFPNA